jgi:ribosomal protein S6
MDLEKEVKLYEVAYLISPSKSEEEAKFFHEALKNSIPSLGGLVEENGSVIKRRLYYPIKKIKEAYFAHFKFLINPKTLVDLKKKLEEKDVLRYLLVETKRVPQRVYKPRVFKSASANETVTPKTSSESAIVEPAINVEEIDKKLEEILGK